MARGDTAIGEGRIPGLDGIRALAVGLVMAYHGGIAGLRVAGFFGVDVFFVLSGFLITRLLLAEQAERGRIGFTLFWSRRARRLLPALLVMLAAVEGYVAFVAKAGRDPGFRSDALSTVLYWSNWHFIAASSNYFSATGLPSLLTHTWSLAIEEQFYIVWPLVICGAVWVAGRTGRRAASLVLAVTSAGSLASAAWMAALYHSGADLSRLYYGTDTHAQSILVGCALAALTEVVAIRCTNRSATVGAVLVLGSLGSAACTLSSSDPVTYQGGFLAVSLLVASLVAVVVSAPSSAPSRVLAYPPLAYMGRISYGMYLWYFPLFAVIDRTSTGLAGGGLFLVRCAADIVAAVISFHLIEQPIRRWRPRPLFHMPPGLPTLAASVTAALAAALLVVLAAPTIGPGDPVALASKHAPSTGGDGMRILVFGDSTAATLGDDLAFSQDAQQQRIVLDVVGIFGCGLVTSAAESIHGRAASPPAACRAGSPSADGWPALLGSAIDEFAPSVVLVASGRWEVSSRQTRPGGSWVDITQPPDAARVRSQLQTAASIVIGSGARLALATAPCYSSGEQPDGHAWPEDSVKRLAAYNRLVRQVAEQEGAGHPGAAAVVDLDSIVCPRGKFHGVIGGVTVRAPDGVHYPFFNLKKEDAPAPDTLAQAEAFGAWIEPKIIDQLG